MKNSFEMRYCVATQDTLYWFASEKTAIKGSSEAKGFVSESDLAPHWWEDQQAKKLDKLKEQDKLTDTYNSKVTEYGGDKIRAMTETFTTEACLDGSLQETFNEKITI
jgi:hypothetical protein